MGGPPMKRPRIEAPPVNGYNGYHHTPAEEAYPAYEEDYSYDPYSEHTAAGGEYDYSESYGQEETSPYSSYPPDTNGAGDAYYDNTYSEAVDYSSDYTAIAQDDYSSYDYTATGYAQSWS